MTRLATGLLPIIHFYLHLQIPTIVVGNVVMSPFHVGFTSCSQECDLKGSDQKMKVCTFSCCFISIGEFFLSASIMLQFSLALLGRGDNSKLSFFSIKSWTIFSAYMMQMSFFSFFGQRKASGFVTQHIQQRL